MTKRNTKESNGVAQNEYCKLKGRVGENIYGKKGLTCESYCEQNLMIQVGSTEKPAVLPCLSSKCSIRVCSRTVVSSDLEKTMLQLHNLCRPSQATSVIIISATLSGGRFASLAAIGNAIRRFQLRGLDSSFKTCGHAQVAASQPQKC